MADTAYASCGDLSIAYQVFGDGPVELVVAGSFVSHVELFWTVPECVAFFERLSTFCRVLLFDKAGVGLSDPVPHVRTVDERATEIEAVMDAVGFRKAVIFGASESGPASIVFAATRPQRTQALILTGTFAYFGFAGWDDLDRDPAELRARLVPELGEDYTPSVKQLARWQAWCRAAGSAWGSGEALKALLPSVRTSMRQLGMVERMSASPGMARAALEAAFRIDVRPILPTISAPTLVIHARDEAIPVQEGRYIADHIPGARLLEVEGSDHVPWLADPDRILTGMEEFLTGSHAAPSPSRRALRTVLFTDMVACRRNTPRRRATSGGGRCCTGSTRSPRSSRSDSAARWWRARATATSSRSTARRRRSAAPRRCVLRPRHWASRSALASTPASANCGTTASAGLPYTSRRGSSVRPAPGRSSSPAP